MGLREGSECKSEGLEANGLSIPAPGSTFEYVFAFAGVLYSRIKADDQISNTERDNAEKGGPMTGLKVFIRANRLMRSFSIPGPVEDAA